MANDAEGSIACTVCDRKYRWKPQLAGRKMKCKCGQVIVMPIQPDDIDYMFAMAKTENSPTRQTSNCPSCGTRLKSGAALCISCGHNLKTGDVVQTAINAPAFGAAASAPMEEPVGGIYANAMASRKKALGFHSTNDPATERRKHVYIPLGMAVVSFIILCVSSTFLGDTLISSVTEQGISLAVMIPILLLGLFTGAKFLDIGYGPLNTALLKLAAILLVPDACFILIFVLFGSSGMLFGSFAVMLVGGVLGWAMSIIVYYFLISYLFDLDPNDTFKTVIALFLTKLLLGIIINVVFESMAF